MDDEAPAMTQLPAHNPVVYRWVNVPANLVHMSAAFVSMGRAFKWLMQSIQGSHPGNTCFFLLLSPNYQRKFLAVIPPPRSSSILGILGIRKPIVIIKSVESE